MPVLEKTCLIILGLGGSWKQEGGLGLICVALLLWFLGSRLASGSLEVPSRVLLLCTCSALHTTSPQPLQCQLISTQISYSLSALSLQKLLLYTFTANKCARGLRTVCKKQGKGKCNLKGYSPWNCALNALA